MKTVKKMYGTYMYERYLFAKEKDRFTRKLKRVNKQLEISGKSDIKALSYVNDGNCYLGSCSSFLLSCVTAEITNTGCRDWIMATTDEEDQMPNIFHIV